MCETKQFFRVKHAYYTALTFSEFLSIVESEVPFTSRALVEKP